MIGGDGRPTGPARVSSAGHPECPFWASSASRRQHGPAFAAGPDWRWPTLSAVDPVDPFWNLVIQASTALVAGAALVLSVMNYRREKRRDEVRVHVALRNNQTRKAGDPTNYADSITAEVTNTGQRPTTLQAIALVFARRRLWRWGIGKTYV